MCYDYEFSVINVETVCCFETELHSKTKAVVIFETLNTLNTLFFPTDLDLDNEVSAKDSDSDEMDDEANKIAADEAKKEGLVSFISHLLKTILLNAQVEFLHATY